MTSLISMKLGIPSFLFEKVAFSELIQPKIDQLLKIFAKVWETLANLAQVQLWVARGMDRALERVHGLFGEVALAQARVVAPSK